MRDRFYFLTTCTFLLLHSSFTFALTDAQIVGAVFSNQSFVSSMNEDKLKEIEINEISKNNYLVVVNAKAPLTDGCSFSAIIIESSERFAINPSTSGLKKVIKVTQTKSNCPNSAND